MSEVAFIDTSVLCNIVPVPGRAQDHEEVIAEMSERLGRGVEFILPITAVIETGNFIAQIADGRQRRTAAEKLRDILKFVAAGEAPWILHDFPWDATFLTELLDE